MDFPRSLALIPLLPLFMALPGCTGTIFKQYDASGNSSITTGPRQRAIISREPRSTSRPGRVDPANITCAEPSPDVAVALASAFGASGSAFGYGSGSLTQSQTEGVAQLAERTVAIQLLRDQMYRTCEAYANGAITGTTYTMTMNRMNDTMVTLLIGESAAGAVGRSLAAVGGKTSSEAEATLIGVAGATAAAEHAAENYVAAEVALANAQATLTDKQKILDDAEENSDTKEKQKDVDDAKKEVIEATARRDLARDQLKASTEAATKASAEITKVEAGGGIEIDESADLARVLGEMQGRFIGEASDDEYISTCLVELANASYYPEQTEKLEDLMDVWWGSDTGKKDDVFYKRLQLTTLDRLGYTSLADHCWNNLDRIVTQDQTDRRVLAEFDAEIRLNDSKARLLTAESQGISSFKGAIESCSKLDDPSRSGQCVSTALQLSGRSKGVGTSRPGPRSTILPIVIFREAERMNASFDAARRDLVDTVANSPPPVPVLPDNPTQDQIAAKERAEELAKVSASLAVEKSSLVAELTTLAAKAAALLTVVEETNITNLQRELPTLQGEYLAAQTDVERQRISAAIGLQQAKATELQVRYTDFVKELREQRSAAQALTASIKSYNAQ